MTSEAIEQRVLAFAQDAKADDFGDLALALFEHQYPRFPLYRQHCEELGVAPTSISNWREIPAAVASEIVASPSADFHNRLVHVALSRLVSSDRAGLVIDTESESAGALVNAVIGALADHASESSLVSRGRLAAKALRSWLGARQRDRLPVRIISTEAGFENLTDLLGRRGLKFRLPPASTAFCVTPARQATAWSAPLRDNLGIYTEACRRVICRSSTPLLESTEATEEASGVFRLPHWVRMTADSEGTALLDLASIGAPAHRIELSARRGADAHSLILA